MIEAERGKVTINGGFFWVDESQPAIRAEGHGHWLVSRLKFGRGGATPTWLPCAECAKLGVLAPPGA